MDCTSHRNPAERASSRLGRSRGLPLLALLLATCAACRTIDFDHPKTESYAFTDTEDTLLGRELAQLPEPPRAQAGFHLLEEGVDALAARLLLARRAERSIDAQYYLITNDLCGYAFINELLAAAERGVRVRLLIDDIQTAGYDDGMWMLDNHPNIEIRVFNPFKRGRFARISSAVEFRRVNRRMHNKSFTVDNQLTVIGGRNIADEYFAARPDVNFGDLDLMCAGPVVDEVSDMFDEYWNHPLAVPVPVFIEAPSDVEAVRKSLRERLDAKLDELAQSAYKGALDHYIDDWIETDQDPFHWCHYSLVYDSPDKGFVKRTGDEPSIMTPFRLALDEAADDFLIISPYFVPRYTGEQFLEGLVERGLTVRVITNSLAANNHAVVHSGYAPSRPRLLEAGVELYEARPDIGVRGAEATRSTLHTKAFIIDRERIFIGSFNMDPRSVYINTEMGVILDSPEISEAAAREVEEQIPEKSYRVYLDEHDRLRWSTWENGEQLVYRTEPETGFWQRFVTVFMGIFPIKAQL